MEKGKSKLVRSQTVKHEVGQRPRPQTVAAASNHAMNRQNADLVRELRNNQIFKSQCYRLGKWDRRKSASLDDLRGEKPGTPPVAKEKSLSIASIEGGIVKRRVEILKTLEAVSDGNGNQKTSNRFPVSPTLEEPELRSSGQRPPRSHTIQILYGGTPKLSPNLPKSPKCDECSGTYEKVLKITGHGIDKKLPKGSLIKIDGGRIIIDEKGKREVLRENIQFESKRLEGKKFIVLVDSEKNHYQLQFDKEKDARQCLPPERTYIRDILRKLLRKRSSKDVLERKGIIRKEPIFGNTLKNLQDKFGTAIPKFVSDSIRLIEMPENITSQFLYRASGNLAIIQKIRFEVDRDKLDILNEYSKDVDVLTGALKLFFRELSDPLITHDIYSELIKLIGEECCAISTKVIKLLSRLPESHRETLLAIVNHLLKVERYKDDNKMDLYNLSVVWGPSLIWFPDKTLNENVLKTSSDAVKVMEMILNVYKGCPSPMLQKRIDSPMTPKLPYKFKSSSESLSSSTIHTERSDNLSHTDSFRENTSQSDESVNSTEVCYRSAMSKGVFGNSLENLEKISKEPLPEFVKRMVELIDSNIGCVGLYRQSGEKTKMDKIKAKIKKNKFSSLDKYSKDTMELACLLKHFFMELRTPLIPRAVLDAFIKNFDNVEPKKFGSFILNNERSTRIPGTRKLDDNNVEPKKFWNFTLNNERSTRIPGTRKLDNSWVYGNSLENLHEASKDDVPKIVRKMVELIEQNKGCAGLYRQSGEKTKMVKIKGIIQKNNISLLDAHSKDTAELACLLKQFFTELKTPLIPYDVLDKFIESYDLDEEERRVRLEKHIKKSLPDPHLAMLEFLLKHLSKVIDDEQNMMSKEALCIVWAPVLFLLKHDNDFDKMTQLLDKAVKLTEMLVDIYAPSDLKIQNRDKCKSGFDEVEVEAVIPDTDSDSDSVRHDMETKL